MGMILPTSVAVPLMPLSPVQQTEQMPFSPSASTSVGVHIARDSAKHADLHTNIRTVLMPAMHLLDYLLESACATRPISPMEALGSWLANEITYTDLQRLTAIAGVPWDQASAVAKAARRKPETIETFTLRNREMLTDNEYTTYLRQLGFVDDKERNLVGNLRFEVPGPSDLVRFAVRHVFEPDLIKRQGYNIEFDQLAAGLDPFHHAVGLDYPIFTGPMRKVVESVTGKRAEDLAAAYTAQNLPEPTWARAYWWSHYVTISPSQAYEAFFRLDPTRDKTGEPDWMQPLSFDLADLRLQLRVNDYAPPMRDLLAAIAYRPPNLRFLRVQIQTKTIDHKGAVSQLKQMGFRPDYAELQASALEAQISEQEAEKLWRNTQKELDLSWELGLISDDEYRRQYMDAGIDTALADAELQRSIATRLNKVAKGLISKLQKAYIDGRYRWDEVDRFLSQVGVVDRRKAEYRTVWDAEKEAGQKEVTAAQAAKYTVDGLITLQDYAQRLRNLNYADEAILLLLAGVKYDMAIRQAKIAADAAKSLDRRNRLQERAARQLLQAAQESQRELASHGSPAKLKTWYCDGLISASEVTNRLTQLGWPQDDITRLLSECDAKRAAAGLQTYQQETGQRPG
jgi:hypothetical protein